MFYIGILILVALDLITKFLAHTYLGEKINLIGDFLYFQYVENTGIAFSIPIEGVILKILTIVIICIIFWYYKTEEQAKKDWKIDMSFIFIFAGALGNGYERIFHGKVIDFIGVKYFSVFNLADIWITLGVSLYVFIIILLSKEKNV